MPRHQPHGRGLAMPTRPVPPEDARMISKSTWLPPEWFPPLDDLRGGPSLSGWLWDAITARLGYADEIRRETPRARRRQQTGQRSRFPTVRLSPRILTAIEDTRGGLTVSEWIRETVRHALLEAGKLPEAPPSPPPVAANGQDPAKAAALDRIARITWPEDPAARNEKIRSLHSAGELA